ncbi:TetR family transcriptional regulator [Haematobacter missouriensis]|uniref:TetR family transcriptional regulator n=1 Tax=Haematobacter missouriensis TaxID=366616 RepID=A0A212AM11_9RHOB|nr:TetR/AcrR family transcriptional regulator [Haematobacter missouriensis]KFI32916.1 TetR family transcriptional regulator [Haematobacter missouriensis]OWJ73152.1 TetR family transcriptional regulator [Haematobacter missouriensis]OWJ82531.1 TetR family transcriptional regulator [Haematobacter missouriensis]
MGRKQTIDRAEILRAVETVVARDGAAGLTIGAVAAEMGISKAGVLYDFGSKEGLILAYTESRIDGWREEVREREIARKGEANQRLNSILDKYQACAGVDDSQIALAISAAMVASHGCRDIVRRAHEDDIQTIISEAVQDVGDPAPALIAYLALWGLKSLEFQGVSGCDPALRDKVVTALRALPFLSLPLPLASENTGTE